MPDRPRLTPAMADVRRAVRETLAVAFPDARARVTRDPACMTGGGWVIPDDAPLVLVALSGGPDSLALAAALAFEASKCGVRAGAVIVDHALQPDSASVAERAVEQASTLGLAPVVVERVSVTTTSHGPESDARDARYDAFRRIAITHGAGAVLLGHTMDDQAETVLLGLARGSGARSLAGMRHVTFGHPLLLRPLLGISRVVVHESCSDQGLTPWQDPHNADPTFTRVRVREHVLPAMEDALGGKIVEALARTAALLSDDADALDSLAEQAGSRARDGESLRTDALEELPRAVRTRVVRAWLIARGASAPTFTHVDSIDRLVTHWSGQEAIDVAALRVVRRNNRLEAEQI